VGSQGEKDTSTRRSALLFSVSKRNAKTLMHKFSSGKKGGDLFKGKFQEVKGIQKKWALIFLGLIVELVFLAAGKRR